MRGRLLWLRSISCSPLDGGRTLPRWCLFLVGRVQKIGRFEFWGSVTCGIRGVGGKFAGFLYGWASEDGVWAGCVHWFGQICTFKKERPGEIGARGANPPKKVHLSRIPQCARPGTGIAPAPVADCRLCAPGTSAAPVLHLAWQNPAPASPPPRSPTADCATPDSAAPALPVRTACPPHPVLPDHSPRRPTCKRRNAAPTEMVDAASTPKGE